MKMTTRNSLNVLMSGVAVLWLMGTSLPAQVQSPYLNTYLTLPANQRDEQLHRVQQVDQERQFLMEVQTDLQILGLYSGPIDGVWGPGSARSLEQFLEMARLDGWGRQSQEALRVAAQLFQMGEVNIREAINRALVRDDTSTEAAIEMANEGIDLYDVGDYTAAAPLFADAAIILSRTLGPEHPDTRGTRGFLASSLFMQGRYAEAEAVRRDLLASQERELGPEDPRTLKTQHNIALGLALQGRFSEAEALQRALISRRERILGPEHPDTLNTRNTLASTLGLQGRYADAEVLLRELLLVEEGVLGPEHPNALRTQVNLATILAYQGRYLEAEALQRVLVEINQRVLGPEHPDTLTSKNNLASTLTQSGHHAEAEALQRELLAVQERVLGPEHPSTLTTRGNLGTSLAAQGRHSEAEGLERELLAVRERVLGPEHPNTLTTFNNLANSVSNQGRYAEAEALERELLSVQKRVLGPAHPDTLTTHNNLSASLSSQGLFVDAMSVLEDSFVQIPTAVYTYDNNYLSLSSYLELAWSADGLEVPHRASRTFVAQGYLTYGSLDVASGAVSARLQADEGAELLRQFQDASEDIQRLRRAYLAAYEPTSTVTEMARERIQQDMGAAQNAFSEISARLERDFPALAEIELPRALSAEEAQELLEPDEGLLAYAATENHLYAWLITQDRVEWFRMDMTSEDLAERVARLREGLDQSLTPSGVVSGGCAIDDTEGYWNSFDLCAAHDLYDLVLGQIDLSGIDELLVVPDGALETIPFSVLVSEIEADGAPQWLVERHAITTLPATSSLRALRLYSTTEELAVDDRHPFLGIAPVTFSQRSDDSPLRGASIPDLPGTDDEVRLLSAFLGADEEGIILGDAATEHFVRTAALDQYRVLSFATHGFLSRETSEFTDGAINEMALALRSGQGEDGLLTSSEAATLRLNADWVLLSACNTAASEGGDDAEGLSGLARAFFYAGAETLLVSHWPIDDEATPTLLTDVMMRSQSDDISRAQSLRQAQLAMLSQRQYAHPFYWAPFSVVGDNR